MPPCIGGLDTQTDSAKVIAETKQSSANENHYLQSNPCCVTVERCPVNGGAYLAKPHSAKPYSAVQESDKPYFAKPGNC